jgi:hypothetical protein
MKQVLSGSNSREGLAQLGRDGLFFPATGTGAPTVLTEVRYWKYQGPSSLQHQSETPRTFHVQMQKTRILGRTQLSAFQRRADGLSLRRL